MKDILKKNTFLRACIDNKNTDLFKAIYITDGKSEDIPDQFAGIYESLYNSVDDNQELIGLQHTLNTKINGSCMNEVTKVTSSVIADAGCTLKLMTKLTPYLTSAQIVSKMQQ